MVDLVLDERVLGAVSTALAAEAERVEVDGVFLADPRAVLGSPVVGERVADAAREQALRAELVAQGIRVASAFAATAAAEVAATEVELEGAAGVHAR